MRYFYITYHYRCDNSHGYGWFGCVQKTMVNCSDMKKKARDQINNRQNINASVEDIAIQLTEFKCKKDFEVFTGQDLTSG